jgi:ATP-dependent DNA ligase
MARRDSRGVRLLTRRGQDWTPRLGPRHGWPARRSYLIDGEAVACSVKRRDNVVHLKPGRPPSDVLSEQLQLTHGRVSGYCRA